MIHAKSPRELCYMRDAGRIVARTHEELAKAAKPGIRTKELDQIAEDYIISQGAMPSFKGYRGFPATICTSVNHVVVHGIPSLEIVENGDIISIDIGAISMDIMVMQPELCRLVKFLRPQRNYCRSQKKVCTKGLSRPLLETGSPIYPTLYRLMWKTMVFLWYVIIAVMELAAPCMKSRRFQTMEARDMVQD